MKVHKVNQYSVFLINEPGALTKFAGNLTAEGINIIALSSDVKYEAAILKFIVEENPKIELSKLISTAGYTSVKTEAICVETPTGIGVVEKIGALLGTNNINISSIYGSAIGKSSQIVLTVDDLEKAVSVLADCQWPEN